MSEEQAVDVRKLIEENNFLKKIINEVPVTIHINKVDMEGNNMPVWVNDNYQKLVGYTLEEREKLGSINSKSGIYHPDDVKVITNAIQTIMNDRSMEESIVFRFFNKAGERRWLFVYSKAIEYHGDPNHFLCIGFDITDRIVLNEKELNVYISEIAQLRNELTLVKLTKTEKEIIKALSKGKTTKEIARERSRSYDTINNHKRNIFRKLGICKINELVSFAKESGLY